MIKEFAVLSQQKETAFILNSFILSFLFHCHLSSSIAFVSPCPTVAFQPALYFWLETDACTDKAFMSQCQSPASGPWGVFCISFPGPDSVTASNPLHIQHIMNWTLWSIEDMWNIHQTYTLYHTPPHTHSYTHAHTHTLSQEPQLLCSRCEYRYC